MKPIRVAGDAGNGGVAPMTAAVEQVKAACLDRHLLRPHCLYFAFTDLHLTWKLVTT